MNVMFGIGIRSRCKYSMELIIYFFLNMFINLYRYFVLCYFRFLDRIEYRL